MVHKKESNAAPFLELNRFANCDTFFEIFHGYPSLYLYWDSKGRTIQFPIVF